MLSVGNNFFLTTSFFPPRARSYPWKRSEFEPKNQALQAAGVIEGRSGLCERNQTAHLTTLHVCEACRPSLSPLPTILLSSPQFLTSPLCLTLTLLPHRPTSN
jgi:hypothetical protein